MGPLIVLDKSAIQSFSRDEVWMLTKHYLVVVVPVLLFEVLGDLKKEGRDGRLGQDDVTWLAGKLLDSDSKLNVPYQAACIESMLGNDPASGFVLLGGAKKIEGNDGRRGVFFDEPKEYEVLRNWRAGRYSEAEELMAEDWRQTTAEIDLEGIRKTYSERFKNIPAPRTVEQIVAVVDDLLMKDDIKLKSDLLTTLLDFIQGPEEFRNRIFDRWLKSGMPRLAEFSPYSNYCLRTLLVFYGGVAYGVISTRATNRVDLEYFFYAHFGYVFCSNDKFHRQLAPYVLGPFHTFVQADDLKKDLRWLHDEWAGLSEAEREQRAYDYGSYPPQNADSITAQLWVKYMRPWTPGSGNRALRMTEEEKEKLIEELKPFIDALDKQ